ncbi:MAG: hypothetical protein LUG60_00285 [Erysipelotrichaceae bacterium]|nr:hypothetical protein [Erysipelotrichaceae bacterium]
MLQNKKLYELGYCSKEDKVEYESYIERGIDKLSYYHLSRYHYEELEQLKKQYSYIKDIEKRNEKIIEDREGKLTKRQIHNLRAEIYNLETNQSIDKNKIINEAISKAFSNKAQGYVNHELSYVGKRALTNAIGVAKNSIQDIANAANQQNKRGR